MEKSASLYREDYQESKRHFTTNGFHKLNELLLDLSMNDLEAEHEFLTTIRPWIDRIKERLLLQVIRSRIIDDHAIEDVITDTLMLLLNLVKSGQVSNWTSFSARFQTKLQYTLKSIGKQKAIEELMPNDDLDTFIVNEPDYAWVDELESGIEGLLKLLKERNRTILMRYVDGDTVNNIALNYGLTRSRVDMIIADARRRLWFHPEKSKVIAEWVEAQRQPPRRIQNELERMGEARARNILRLEAHTEKFD